MLTKKIMVLGSFALLPSFVFSHESVINSTLPSDGVGTTEISGFTFENQTVTYEKINGLGLFQGDIVLGRVNQLESVANDSPSGSKVDSIIRTGDRYRWPNNTLVYQFNDVSDQVKAMVYNAFDHWEDKTPITFVERNDSNSAEYNNYVSIVDDEFACWSYVGMIGGEQELNVVTACGLGGTVHEFGHALGLWHEQSREDRNDYVQIISENIIAGREHNFDQHIFDGDDVGEYDYDSLMHYGEYAFSSNGLPTIIPLSPVNIGQRIGLSDGDIAAIKQYYPEDETPVASISETHYSVKLGDSVLISGTRSFDPNGDVLEYSWLLGDGNTYGDVSFVEHTYSEIGSYEVLLKVVDPSGNEDTTTAIVTVYDDEDYSWLIPVVNYILY